MVQEGPIPDSSGDDKTVDDLPGTAPSGILPPGARPFDGAGSGGGRDVPPGYGSSTRPAPREKFKPGDGSPK
jgi:hypothetical protein